MKGYEILILIFNIITFAVAVGALGLFMDLRLEVRGLRFAMEFMEDENEKLKADIDFLKKNND